MYAIFFDGEFKFKFTCFCLCSLKNRETKSFIVDNHKIFLMVVVGGGGG